MNAKCGFRRLGVQDRYGQVGTVDYLKKIYHISTEDIEETALEYLKNE